MSMLSTHLASSSNIVAVDQQDNNIISYAAGICYSIIGDPVFSSKDTWIIDSGATKHVCSIAAAFVSMRIIDNSSYFAKSHTTPSKAVW